MGLVIGFFVGLAASFTVHESNYIFENPLFNRITWLNVAKLNIDDSKFVLL